MIEEHCCRFLPDSHAVIRGTGLWIIHYPKWIAKTEKEKEEAFFLEVTHCPFCGIELINV